MSPRQYAKAVIGSLVAGLSALIPVTEDGLTTSEVLVAVVAALVALGAVFIVPNQAPVGLPADPDLSEQSGLGDAGLTLVEALVVGLVVVVVLILLGVRV